MAWIITKDKQADPVSEPGTNGNALGRASDGYAGSGRELPYVFRMLDADGEVYYVGQSDQMDFDPLDEFGKPNAGCTDIQYKVDGEWQTL